MLLPVWKRTLLWNLWKGKDLQDWSWSKKSYTWPALDIHTNRACLFCCVVLDWQERQAIRKWREASAKALLYFSWIIEFPCLCICSNIRAVCVSLLDFKGIRARLRQGRLAHRNPICTMPFIIPECLLHWESTVAAAQQSMHTEGHPSQGADITIIISYLSGHCWSPSATPPWHRKMHIPG